MATTLTYLDGYCERAGLPSLWAEPLGALTNAGFLIAAWLAWKLYRQRGERKPDVVLLILLLVAIGIGSTLWHVFATRWSLLGDVIPILLFINVYLLSFLIRVVRCRWQAAVGWWLVFQLANFGSEAFLPRDALNGSIMYVPTWLTLALVVGYLYRTRHAAAQQVLLALGLFTASLTFRTVDMAVCPLLPIGTHFLWHVLNSVVLYRLLKVVMVEQNLESSNRERPRSVQP